ncbi:MAG: hypothetical protein HKM02_02145 [Pseudomonadales bacterium]|nr:hypothetical protein [Pseudomonadales bacterium]
MKKIPIQQESGFVLLTSLIMMLLLAILAVSMFNIAAKQHHTVAAMRDKQQAMTNAMSAEQFAEWWVLQGNGSANTGLCTSVATVATSMVCTNALTTPAALPWTALDTTGKSQLVGTPYVPPTTMMTVNTAGGANNIYADPGFYVLNLGTSPDGQGILYQINAYGFGGLPDSVSVVQSTYEVTSGIINRGGL